jgi:hypothetical protein
MKTGRKGRERKCRQKMKLVQVGWVTARSGKQLTYLQGYTKQIIPAIDNTAVNPRKQRIQRTLAAVQLMVFGMAVPQ